MTASFDAAALPPPPIPGAAPETPSETAPEVCLRAFQRQRDTVVARRQGFGLAERRAALIRLRQALIAYEARILAALAADFGKPALEGLLTEILPLRQDIAQALRHLPRWMRPRRVAPSLALLGSRARVRPEPRGVCLILSPWNYPLNLALSPLVSCLAAGNSAILKPSELAPATSALLAELVAGCFPPELVTVIEGGVPTATALLALPFDHVFFTGSPEVGKVVMAAAARHLASVTLELGGKSPAIIGPEADLERAADWIAFGKFVNAGQTCIAPDHVFVHESLRPALRAALQQRLARAYGAGDSPHLARLISARHGARLQRLLAEARQGGAEIWGAAEASGPSGAGVAGWGTDTAGPGAVNSSAADGGAGWADAWPRGTGAGASGRGADAAGPGAAGFGAVGADGAALPGPTPGPRLPPVLVEGLTPEMGLAREEIFGPILPIEGYLDLDEVLARINARPKPLALYVFDRRADFAERVIGATSSGSVGVNATLLQFSHPGLPFGGVNHSGQGQAHGLWGFRAFSHERAVLSTRVSPLGWLFPPYGPAKLRLVRWVMRLLG